MYKYFGSAPHQGVGASSYDKCWIRPCILPITAHVKNVKGSALQRSAGGDGVTILLSVSINKAFIKSCSIDSRNEQSPTCEVVHETKLTSEISFPTDSLLAQLAEHGADYLVVVGSILGRDNFFILLFFFNVGRILPRIGRKFRIM